MLCGVGVGVGVRVGVGVGEGTAGVGVGTTLAAAEGETVVLTRGEAGADAVGRALVGALTTGTALTTGEGKPVSSRPGA